MAVTGRSRARRAKASAWSSTESHAPRRPPARRRAASPRRETPSPKVSPDSITSRLTFPTTRPSDGAMPRLVSRPRDSQVIPRTRASARRPGTAIPLATERRSDSASSDERLATSKAGDPRRKRPEIRQSRDRCRRRVCRQSPSAARDVVRPGFGDRDGLMGWPQESVAAGPRSRGSAPRPASETTGGCGRPSHRALLTGLCGTRLWGSCSRSRAARQACTHIPGY